MVKPNTSPRADLDFEDVKTGFMTGKTAALADWSFRKEQKEFNRTVATLRATKWNKEHLDAHRAHARKYAARPDIVAASVKAARERRHAKHREEARVFVYAAPDCRVEFCRLPGTVKGIPPKWCREACYLRTQRKEKGRKPGRANIPRSNGGQTDRPVTAINGEAGQNPRGASSARDATDRHRPTDDAGPVRRVLVESDHEAPASEKLRGSVP